MPIPAEIFLTWRGCCCCCCCCWFTVCLVLPHGPARFLLLVLTSSLAHKWWVRNYDGDRFISGIFHCIRLTLGLKREHAENSIWICVCVCVQVYAVGGYDGQSRLSSVECYDSFSNRWTEVAPMKEAVSSPAVAGCVNKLYVIGGGPDDNTCSDKVRLSGRTLPPNTSCQSQRLYLSCRINTRRMGRAQRRHIVFRNYY